MTLAVSPVGMPWTWTLAFGHHEGTKRFPTIAADIARLAAGKLVIYGEVVSPDTVLLVASFLTTVPTARGRSANLEIAYGSNWAQGGAVFLSSKIPNSARSARSCLRHPGRNKPYSK